MRKGEYAEVERKRTEEMSVERASRSGNSTENGKIRPGSPVTAASDWEHEPHSAGSLRGAGRAGADRFAYASRRDSPGGGELLRISVTVNELTEPVRMYCKQLTRVPLVFALV